MKKIPDEIELDQKDYFHGTSVSSIIVDGPTINPELDDGCGRFKVRHFGVATSGHFNSFTILRTIDEIVKENRDIKVWNLSLGSDKEIHPNFISPEAAILDKIQSENDVIFIIAGTNKRTVDGEEKYIGSPADSINSLVVNSVDYNNKPVSYSRKGPVLSFFNKPDVSYYGGDRSNPIKVCCDTGERSVAGTSFAAPWIARKMSYLIDVLGLSREVAKALIVDSAASWKKLKDTTSTSFTHTGVESGKTYTYTVRCISSTGKSYKSGYDTSGTKAMFLSTPTVTKISNTADGVKLTYKESKGASKYNIYVNSGSGFKKLGESTTTTFIHEEAKSGTSYTYRVRAYDTTGDFSSYYKTSSKNTFIAAPIIKSALSTEKGVKITWDKVTGAAKYRVFVKSGTSWKKLKDTTSTSYTHTGAQAGKTYTYTVRCISSTGKSYTSGYDTIGSSVLFEK
ncbi:MAG: S8 family serine peptidase [Eubacteriales bacterium]|nr:S8 family serine peptidase [Eubacteriales bacterium]